MQMVQQVADGCTRCLLDESYETHMKTALSGKCKILNDESGGAHGIASLANVLR